MTQKEFDKVRKDALEKIDAAIQEGMRVLDETRKTLEELRIERRAAEETFERIRPYLIG